MKDIWSATLIALCLSGCATAVSGTKQMIRFESVPSGATVRVDGREAHTPAEIELPRNESYDVEFQKAGYLRARRRIDQRQNPWVLGNFLLGGLIGMAQDEKSGGGYYLFPSTVSATLVPDPAAVDAVRSTDPTEGKAERSNPGDTVKPR